MQQFVYEKKTKKIVEGTLDNCMYSMASIGYSLKCVRLVSVLSDLVLFLKFLYIGVIYMLQDFKKIDDFYPTPDFLIDKMLEKVNLSKVKYILEPSAGEDVIIVTRGKNAVFNRVLKLPQSHKTTNWCAA